MEEKLEEKAAGEDKTLYDFTAFDICFKNTDGEEVEPVHDKKLKVSITFENSAVSRTSAQKEGNLSVIHIKDDKDAVEVEADISANHTNEVEKVAFSLDSFSVVVLTRLGAFQAVDTVNPEMTAAQIQKCVDTFDKITFEGGTYQDLALKLDGSKTFYTAQEAVFQSSDGKAFGLEVTGKNLVTLNIAGAFHITGYRDNIYLPDKARLTIHIMEDASLRLTGARQTEANHGNGIWAAYGTELTITGTNGSSFAADSNDMCGINVLGSSKASLDFKNSKSVSLSGNKASSGYHAGMDGWVDTSIRFQNISTVKMADNGWDAINFQAGHYSTYEVVNCKNVDMTGNRGWGTNGGDLIFTDSIIDISDNAQTTDSSYNYGNVGASCSNLYAYSLTATDSVIRANRAGINAGIWVVGKAIINGSELTANGNGLSMSGHISTAGGQQKIAMGGYGMYFGGVAEISNSRLTASDNGKAGIVFVNASSASNLSFINRNSKVTAGGNGCNPDYTGNSLMFKSEMVLITGKLNCEDSVLMLDGNVHDLSLNAVGDSSSFVLDKTGVAAFRTGNIAYLEAFASDGPRRLVVLSGSLQAVRSNMSGTYDLNGVKKSGETYAAPVNNDNTKLTRFNITGSNMEVGEGLAQRFAYYDPSSRSKYEYVFRFNAGDEDLNGQGGNAYVWAPVSIIHYDATEGEITDFGTAQQGYVSLDNSRGDGTSVGNVEVKGHDSVRYATDYTIYGNSMNLSEAVMPEASRSGYTFAGWYVKTADGETKADEMYALAEKGSFSRLYNELNTRFQADTKITDGLDNPQDAVEEITVYAKWTSNTAPTPDPDPDPTPTPSDNPGTTPPVTPVTSVLGTGAAPEISVLGDAQAPQLGVLGDAKGPGTGDTAPIVLWSVVFLAAAGVLGYSISRRKKGGKKSV